MSKKVKLSVDPKAFTEALQWASKTLDQKDDKAFLVFSVNENGSSSLSHMNDSSLMKSNLDIESSENLEKDLNIRLSGPFMSKMTPALKQMKDEITLEFEEENPKNIIIKGSNSRFNVPIKSGGAVKEPETELIGSVNEKELFSYFKELSSICDANNAGSMPALGAVDVHFEEKDDSFNLRVMATDRYSLGIVNLAFDPSEKFEEDFKDNHYLLPHTSTSLIAPSKSTDDQVELLYDREGHKFGYRFIDGREALFALMHVKPITYENIRKKSLELVKYKAIVDKKELQRAMSIMSALSWDDDSIHWTMDKDKVFNIHDLNADNTMQIEAEEFEADKSVNVHFVREIIVESLGPIMTNKIMIEWGESTAPIIIKPILDNGKESEDVFVLASTKNA